MTHRFGVFAVVFVGFLALLAAQRYAHEQAERENRAILAHAAEGLADHLSSEIRARIGTLLDLRAFMLATPGPPQLIDFDAYASRVLARNRGIRALYFADAHRVVRHIYPLVSNPVLGLDLRTRPAAPFVEKAIREHTVTISDPIVTVQGELSIVPRVPLYRGTRLLGLLGAVVPLSALTDRAGKALDPRFTFALRDAHGHRFWGAAPTAGHPVRADLVTVGDQRWTILTYWRQPPPGADPFSLGLIWFVGGALVLAIAFMVERGSRRTQWLAAAVAEKTALLARQNEALASEVAERQQAERALRASEAKFSKAFDASPHLNAITRIRDGRLIAANEAFFRAFGYRREDALGQTLAELGQAEVADAHAGLLAQIEATGCARDVEVLYRSQSGERRVALASAECIEIDNEGCLLVSALDISDRRRSEDERIKLSRALEQTADMVMITDRDGTIEYVNPAFATITGFARKDVIRRKPNILASGRHDHAFYETLWRTITAGHSFREVFINCKRDGSLFYEEKTISPLKDQAGRITHFISTGQDITERMRAEERLQYLASHDLLTGLPNRALFLDRLAHALVWAGRRGRICAVLFLDCDRFKMINDTLGHEAGDRVLQTFADRLGACVRSGDTVARLGGDEFAVLLGDVARPDHVPAVAAKILSAIAQPVEAQGRELFVTTSVGISVSPPDAGDSADLLKNAEAAMYRAKEAGRNCYEFYSADMSAKAVERLSLETALRHALEREQFVLYYQPQVDLGSRRLIGFEALIRWRHPDFGLVPPARFVPLLEETGLIVPVGEWVLRTACAQMNAWRASALNARVAVNLSARQFKDAKLAPMIARTLSESRFDPRYLELEITESVVMDDAETAAQTLADLGAKGVRLAIDDFGTGYSSLSYLKRFPIDTLKIDSSFVRDIPGDADDAAIVGAIIALAHRLDIAVVAEGVETQAQLDFLRARHCNAVQGYFFGQPKPADEVPLLFADLADSGF